jgi:hypothetical protein
VANERSSRKLLCKVVLGSVMYTKYCHNYILHNFMVQRNAEPNAVLGIGFCVSRKCRKWQYKTWNHVSRKPVVLKF